MRSDSSYIHQLTLSEYRMTGSGIMKSIFFICGTVALFLLTSCDLLDSDQYGTGAIHVVMNGQYHDLENVTGTEYMGFFCQGTLSGKSLGISLGLQPLVGDTLLLNTRKVDSYEPPKISYGNNRALTEGSHIIITSRINQTISGTFQCSMVVENDTILFRDGYFKVRFKPSR